MLYLISADCVARYAICAGVGIKHCAEFKADAGFVVLVIGELGAVAIVLKRELSEQYTKKEYYLVFIRYLAHAQTLLRRGRIVRVADGRKCAFSFHKATNLI